MGQYRVVHDYSSGTFGPIAAGDVIEIDDDILDWLLRDSPGVVEPVKAKSKRKRQAKTAKNRMVKAATNRSEPEQVMTSENMPGLVKD